ncbi:hypothetical protein ACN94_19090 [Gordonia paraffinivorans]|nr:hypothetical protein [Gordonia paraffinivorans]PWD42231.1 hypothetical protein ACN93_15165 [Gordonia paraffinivorans]
MVEVGDHMTDIGSAHTVSADAMHQACVACVCVRELRGEGTCVGTVGSEGLLDAGTVTAFVVAALVILVLAVVVYRREHRRPGPRTTSDGDPVDRDLIGGDRETAGARRG